MGNLNGKTTHQVNAESTAALGNLSLLETVRRLEEEAGIGIVYGIDALNDVLKKSANTEKGLVITHDAVVEAFKEQGGVFQTLHAEQTQQFFDIITDTFTDLQEEFNELSPQLADTSAVTSYTVPQMSVVLDENGTNPLERDYVNDASPKEARENWKIESLRVDHSITQAMDSLKSDFLNIAQINAKVEELQQQGKAQIEEFNQRNIEETKGIFAQLRENEDSITEGIEAKNTEVEALTNQKLERFGNELASKQEAIKASYMPQITEAEREYLVNNNALLTAKLELAELEKARANTGSVATLIEQKDQLSRFAGSLVSSAGEFSDEIDEIVAKQSTVVERATTLQQGRAAASTDRLEDGLKEAGAENVEPKTILGKLRAFAKEFKEAFVQGFKELKEDSRLTSAKPEADPLIALEEQWNDLEVLRKEAQTNLDEVDQKIDETQARIRGLIEQIDEVQNAAEAVTEDVLAAAREKVSLAAEKSRGSHEKFNGLLRAMNTEKAEVQAHYENLSSQVLEDQRNNTYSFTQLLSDTQNQAKEARLENYDKVTEETESKIADLEGQHTGASREKRFTNLYENSAGNVRDIIAKTQEKKSQQTPTAYEAALAREDSRQNSNSDALTVSNGNGSRNGSSKEPDKNGDRGKFDPAKLAESRSDLANGSATDRETHKEEVALSSEPGGPTPA